MIIVTILILGVIIFVHEWGHFITAKLCKMPVGEFSIGMGPELLSYDGKETKYTLRGIPMGGYVNIKGMEVDSEEEDGFNTKSPIKRFMVLFAGVFMNFTTAFVLLFGMIMVMGEYIPDMDKTVIGGTVEDGASHGKLVEGDIIRSIDGIGLGKWDDITTLLTAREIDEKAAKIVVVRDGKEMLFDIDLKYNEKESKYYLGVYPGYKKVDYGIVEGLSRSQEMFVDIFSGVFKGFGMMFRGEVKKEEMKGPIGMVGIVKDFYSQGFAYLVFLTALLSINIGILNLLPFPALDGGRIVFVILEMFRIKVDKKMEEKVHKVGLVVLLVLILFISYNDVANIISSKWGK